MTDRRSASHAGEPTLPHDERDQETNRQFEHELAAAHAAQLAGDVAGARDLIERALRYKPRDQRARNLLGLTLFKLGELARAEAIYRGLIEDYPADPTLRVNLGLVFLKHGASTDAARCFTTALDLQPEHTKAQNYLGLALAQKGEHKQARDWFILAGNTAMAERMDGLLAAQSPREPAPAPPLPAPPSSSLEAPIGRMHLETTQVPASAVAPKTIAPDWPPAEPVRDEPAEAPPAEVEPVRSEPVHVDPVSSEPAYVEPPKLEAMPPPIDAATSALSTSEVYGAAPPADTGPIDRGPVARRHDSGTTSEFSKPVLPPNWAEEDAKANALAGESATVKSQPGVEKAKAERRERQAAKTDPSMAPINFQENAASQAASGSAIASSPAVTTAAATGAARSDSATDPNATVSSSGLSGPNATDPGTAKLSAYTNERRLAVPTAEGSFAIGPAEVVIQVHGEMLTRLDGLVASWGTATIRSELKRFRGKATDKTFGEGSRRMLRASGEGRYVISREGRAFTALELGDEPAYFREEVIFAFEETLTFENGRVPSKLGSDLHLVHLRGRGRLLLVSAGVPRSVEVKKGEPLRIPMEQLIGWHGPLIQPRVVPIVEEAPELGVALELAGEGRALVDAPHG